MNGLLKRPGSPTTSDSSKENIDEEDNNNMSGLTRWAEEDDADQTDRDKSDKSDKSDKWKYWHEQKLKVIWTFPPRYPCPICKKAFSKVGNVYKHLAGAHNKSKTEYLKMSKTIRNNAYIDEKENEIEETPPKLQFVKARPPEEAMQVNC